MENSNSPKITMINMCKQSSNYYFYSRKPVLKVQVKIAVFRLEEYLRKLRIKIENLFKYLIICKSFKFLNIKNIIFSVQLSSRRVFIKSKAEIEIVK